jgi:type I restriction enzyme M protein
MHNEEHQFLNDLDKRLWTAAVQVADGEAFEDKMARLTATLRDQFAESARLEAEIRKNLAGLGYEF